MTIKEFRTKYHGDAEFIIGVMLWQMTDTSIKSCIKARLDSVNKQIKALKDDDFIYECNQTLKVNWALYEKTRKWDITPEEQEFSDAVYKTLSLCEKLIYERNRLIHISMEV